jgi:hypothetical protein
MFGFHRQICRRTTTAASSKFTATTSTIISSSSSSNTNFLVSTTTTSSLPLSSSSLLVSSRRFQATTTTAAVNPARIEKSAVWNLWNEGNLFSMSVPELEAFLKNNGVEIAAGQKKAALVRKTEEFMAKENPIGVVNAAAKEETVQSISEKQTERLSSNSIYRSTVVDLYDEADVYADWTSNIDEKKHDDFISFPTHTHKNQALTEGEIRGKSYLNTKAYQLLHQECTSDLGLAKSNVSKLPGCGHLADKAATLSIVAVKPDDANKVRFRRGFHWAVTNMWSAAIDAEVNIGAGKALYWKRAAKQQRPVLPLWTCQQHVHDAHPYSWYAVAHETSIAAMEALANKQGMTLTSDNEVSYKVFIKRTRDILDLDLNSQLQPTLVNRPWERYLVTHYVREKMPDLRFLVRGRHSMKKRVTDQYLEASILTANGNTVQSVLQPELGDVVYVGHRSIRRWTTKMANNGIRLSLVETRRTPLVTTRTGDEGERIEYEWIANVPQQSENVDIPLLAEELWDKGQELAIALENSMQELHAFTMSSAAAFVRSPRRGGGFGHNNVSEAPQA